MNTCAGMAQLAGVALPETLSSGLDFSLMELQLKQPAMNILCTSATSSR
jgi:hypothetical protein